MESGGTENQSKPTEDLRIGVETETKSMKSCGQLHGVLHMYSGNGDSSYAENSTRQRYVFHVLQPLFKAAIEKLIIPKEGPIRIADLGCATGLNTILDMNFVTRTLTNLCIGSELEVPPFQAFHSDLTSNDFNGFFNLLVRPTRPYFVAGVPGSFYNVLFPNSSIHVSFSIMALHWISEGIVGLDLRDSFNLPWYFPNSIEVRKAVEECGAFEIERVEVCQRVPTMSEKAFEQWVKEPSIFAKMKANLVKSFVGSLVEAHIGIERSDMLFQRFEQRAAALLHSFPPSRFATCTVASLIRK